MAATDFSTGHPRIPAVVAVEQAPQEATEQSA